MTKTRWIVAVAMVAFVVAGCGGKTAKTPKDAVLNFAKAFSDSDKDLFLASIKFDEKDKPAVEAMFDMGNAFKKFHDKLVKAYGKEAVDKLGKKDNMDIPTPEEIEKKVKITENGDKATAKMEGESKPWQLVKVDGAWKIDWTEMMGKDMKKEQVEGMIKMSKAAVKAAEEVSKDIGKSGSTAESINKAFGEKMFAAMMEGAKDMMPK